MDYQGWEVQEAHGNSGTKHIEEVFGQCNLVDEKLELEEVFTRFTHIMLHIRSFRLYHG